MAEARLGGKLRRLRRERKLSQAQMAEQLGISPSYLNLLEHNQRPVTVPVLLKLAQRFAIDLQEFNEDEDNRLLSDLMEAFADTLFEDHDIKAADLKDLVAISPNLGRALLALYQAYRGNRSVRPAEMRGDTDSGEPALGQPAEEVSDFLQQHRNHFPELEAEAETIWRDNNLTLDNLYRGLVDALAQKYAVDVEILPASVMGVMLRDYNPLRRRLALSEMLPISSRNFQLAHQIGLLGANRAIERLASSGKFTTADSNALARIALASYFAGCLLMPYERFIEAAQATRYDTDILCHRFGVSFEQMCHRLTSLARPGQEGIPFHLVRVDIAGNISKRFSASGIAIARFGPACPRWNVYDTFATPGIIRTQISRMPDGATYFCVARTVQPAGISATRGGALQRVRQHSIGLGCAVSYARQIVHADGIALDDPKLVTPIGVSCNVCERLDCADRAMPSMHHKLEVDENKRALSTYLKV